MAGCQLGRKVTGVLEFQLFTFEQLYTNEDILSAVTLLQNKSDGSLTLVEALLELLDHFPLCVLAWGIQYRILP